MFVWVASALTAAIVSAWYEGIDIGSLVPAMAGEQIRHCNLHTEGLAVIQ